MTREYPKNTDSSNDDQWEIVPNTGTVYFSHTHQWRLVRIRNKGGILATGVWCNNCGEIERISDRALKSHGQRVERSEK